LTGDEVWIYYNNGMDYVWIGKEEQAATTIQNNNGGKKVMISVYWNPTGIKVVSMVPRNTSFTKNLFVESVLDDLKKEVNKTRPSRLGSGMYLHIDNAKPQCANTQITELGFQRLTHPPYSPDLAPSDFYLFGRLKRIFNGKNFVDDGDLYEKVKSVLYNIPLSELQGAYEEWEWRLNQ